MNRNAMVHLTEKPVELVKRATRIRQSSTSSSTPSARVGDSMGLVKQISARLRAMEKRVGPQTVTCPNCEGPVLGANGFVLLNREGQPKYSVCPSCGLAFRPDGKALAPDPLGAEFPNGDTFYIGGDLDWEKL